MCFGVGKGPRSRGKSNARGCVFLGGGVLRGVCVDVCVCVCGERGR